MRIYTYSEARKKLASLLREARIEGEVRIKRRSGEEFSLRPVECAGSPLDVGEPVKLKARITREDILRAVRESRERDY
jgi:hypothetical protein